MTPADNRRFLALLTGVHSFYRADLTEFSVGVWTRSLMPYDIGAIEQAFDAHARDPKAGSYLPKPADLVRLLDGSHEDRAAIAWSKVHHAMLVVGGYESVAFDDPAIHCAIADLGGWPTVCAGTIDELPHLQRRFCAAYLAHKKAGTAHTPTLIGRHEAANGLGGFATAKPVLIGDQCKAQAVIESGSAAVDRLQHIAGPALRLLER